MSTAEATADLTAVAVSRTEQHEMDYRRAVLLAASGETPHSDQLRAILYDAARSRADFNRHLEVAIRRYQAAQMLAECNALERKIGEIDELRREIELALTRLREEYQSAIAEPLARSAQLQNQRLEARRRMTTLKAQGLAELRATRPVAWDTKHNQLAQRAHALRSQNESDGVQIAKLAPDADRAVDLESNSSNLQTGGVSLSVAEQQELDSARHALEQIDALEDAIQQREQEIVQIEQSIEDHERMLLDWRNFDFE